MSTAVMEVDGNSVLPLAERILHNLSKPPVGDSTQHLVRADFQSELDEVRKQIELEGRLWPRRILRAITLTVLLVAIKILRGKGD